MGIRFRKGVSLAKGVRLNIGKGTLGLSAGIKGARVGVGSRGVYTSAGVPGSGLYSVNYLNKKSTSSSKSKDSNNASSKGCLNIILILLVLGSFSIDIYLGLFLTVLSIIAYVYYQKQPKQIAKSRIWNAKRLIDKNNNKEAIKLLEEAEINDNENIEIFHLLGLLFSTEKDFKKSIYYFNKYLEKDPEDLTIKFFLADSYYENKEYEKAIKILQKLIDILPELEIKIIQLLGACFLKIEKYDESINVLKRAPLNKRKLDDDMLKVYYLLSSAYEKDGDKKSALKCLKKIYSHDIAYSDVSERIKNLEK
ncbi:MAG: DUF4236 domain-containing protein [Patescibacteria group bacterium]|jgi:tetratricopeptide (TPR) repeat protein